MCFRQARADRVTGYTLTGSMSIGLTNVVVTLPDGVVTPLNSAHAATVGKVVTQGDNVNIRYSVNNHTGP